MPAVIQTGYINALKQIRHHFYSNSSSTGICMDVVHVIIDGEAFCKEIVYEVSL